MSSRSLYAQLRAQGCLSLLKDLLIREVIRLRKSATQCLLSTIDGDKQKLLGYLLGMKGRSADDPADLSDAMLDCMAPQVRCEAAQFPLILQSNSKAWENHLMDKPRARGRLSIAKLVLRVRRHLNSPKISKSMKVSRRL